MCFFLCVVLSVMCSCVCFLGMVGGWIVVISRFCVFSCRVVVSVVLVLFSSSGWIGEFDVINGKLSFLVLWWKWVIRVVSFLCCVLFLWVICMVVSVVVVSVGGIVVEYMNGWVNWVSFLISVVELVMKVLV